MSRSFFFHGFSEAINTYFVYHKTINYGQKHFDFRGSPRSNGNSDMLAEAFATGARAKGYDVSVIKVPAQGKRVFCLWYVLVNGNTLRAVG